MPGVPDSAVGPATWSKVLTRACGAGVQLCSIFHVPIAIVSLVDTERQWFKSIQGLPVSETSRKTSFCAWTLLPACPTVLLVKDARLDERCASCPGRCRVCPCRDGAAEQPAGRQ